MNTCGMCGKGELVSLINFGENPIAHHFLDNPTQKEYIHPVNLCFCEHCGLAQLSNPVPPEMFYTEYLCFSSWKHQPHLPEIVTLIEQFCGIKKMSNILEVGCNDGIFLEAIRQKGYQNAIGIEPAHDAYEAAQEKGLKIINAYFDKKIAQQLVKDYGKFELFVARQVLEHIGNLKEFKEAMHIVLAPAGFVVIEIPNFMCNLSTLDYTLWEEHINYFTPETLNFFLADAGIKIIHSKNVLFSGESLIIIGQYATGPLALNSLDYLGELKTNIFKYRDLWPTFRDRFIEYLSGYRKKGSKVAIYGAGARACCLINYVGLAPYINFIVDDQSEKQNKYMPGSKLPILTSGEIEKQSIDLCLLAVNTENEDRVMAKHRYYLKKGGHFFSVLPPSQRLLPVWSGII